MDYQAWAASFVAYFLILLDSNKTSSQSGPTPLPKTCQEGEIRLSHGVSLLEGRVDVCVTGQYGNGVWGTVCDDGWDHLDTKVVCRQLGRQLGVEVFGGVTRLIRFGQASFTSGQDFLPVNLADVACNGTEDRLLDCDYVKPIERCNHNEDVGVTCILTNSSLLPACSEELVNYTSFSLPFICHSGQCINDPSRTEFTSPFICNGTTECGDCSDECHCNSRYRTGERHSGECRARNVTVTVCDCTEEEFQCENGFCLDRSMLCDMVNDCGDNSDETAQECIDIRNQFRQDVRDKDLGRTIGSSLGLVAFVTLFGLFVLGLCMLSSKCPLRKAYSFKPVVVPDPNVVMMLDQAGGMTGELEGVAGGVGGAGEIQELKR